MTSLKTLEAAALRADIALAREHAPAAIERLAELVKVDDARISLAAATAILERAYGRAGVAGTEDAPMAQGVTVIERVIVDSRGGQAVRTLVGSGEESTVASAQISAK